MMAEDQVSKGELNRKAAKAGIFYIVAQILVRGITFLVTPVYSRLVSTAQYGEIRTYESWLLILVPVFSLSLYRSVERAKYDFPNRYEEYVSSVQTLSYLSITLFFAIILLLFRDQFMSLCNLDPVLLLFMVGYIYGYTSILFFQRREKQMLRYQQSVKATVWMMLPATVLSVVLLYWGNRTGHQEILVHLRVAGYYTPQIVVGFVLAISMWRQGHFRINRGYWKYAALFSLPLIPELLSIQIMNQSDKIMIQKMVGGDSTGIFALATSVSFVIWVLEDAVWGAWQPWLYEKISRNEVQEIQKPWDLIMLIFGYISWGLVILAPEVIAVLGGNKYREAIILVAPMVTGTLFRFLSYSFTAVENYQKKTGYVALGTVVTMAVNVILNYIFIQMFGYQAAAYTTAFSYLLLLIGQGLLEKKVCGLRCVSLKKTVFGALLILGINLLSTALYSFPWWTRWVILAVVTAVMAWRVLPEFMRMLQVIRKEDRDKIR